jgi:hypothetical protein
MSEQTPESIKQEQAPEADPQLNPDDKVVPREVLDKTIKSKQNWAEKAKALEAEVAALKHEKLKEKEDYKSMYELADKKAKEYEALIEKTKVEKEQSLKLGSLKRELEKMGASKESMEGLLRLADLGTIKYDDENKVAYGIEEEAKRIKSIIPPAFGVSSAGASHAAPKGGPLDVSAEGYKKLFETGEWSKMSKEQRRDYEVRLFESRGVTPKK